MDTTHLPASRARKVTNATRSYGEFGIGDDGAAEQGLYLEALRRLLVEAIDMRHDELEKKLWVLIRNAWCGGRPPHHVTTHALPGMRVFLADTSGGGERRAFLATVRDRDILFKPGYVFYRAQIGADVVDRVREGLTWLAFPP